MALSLKRAFSEHPRSHTGNLSQIFGLIAGFYASDAVNSSLGVASVTGRFASSFVMGVAGYYAGRAAHNLWSQWKQERGIPPLIPWDR